MQLISTGKSTVLTEFSDLDTKFIYRHVNSESTDFQFCAQTRIFVEVNKKSGLEILRIKEKGNQKFEIQRVRKLTIKNVYCVACAKQAPEEMALGLSNGTVKLYNYKNAEIVKRFNAENIRNSVLYIDYNASDEYICSVCENGQINIYGIKTSAKIDTVNIDGNSTLARFHPTKRFHMAIASYKGTVSIYDVQTKRKLFHSVDSHGAPCRDLCMSPASPDTLVSVGFDCLVNIFDTRRKTQPLQLRHNHPLSTVALSECGNFCCVGNLKGELIAYDMRKLKYSLGTKKVHDCAVTRIAFVPLGGDSAASFSSTGNLTNASVAAIDSTNADRQLGGGDLRKSLAAKLGSEKTGRGQRDSFCDFLDFQANKGLEKISSRFVTRRDSNDFWDALHRKPSVDEQRASLCPLGVSGMQSAVNSANSSAVTAAYDSFDSKPDFSTKKTTDLLVVPSNQAPASLPLRDQSNNLALTPAGKLVQIQEEQTQQNISSGSDKENPAIDLELLSRLQKLPADRNSTPNRTDRRSEGVHSSAAVAPSKPVAPTESITELRAEMNLRFQQLESEIKFQLETNKWQIFTQNFNLWSKQNQNNEVISDALGILLQTDPFVNEFLRLKQENEELKLQLLSMAKK